MEDRTKEELEHDLECVERLADERAISDARYASKLVERIVFAACALILTAFFAYLFIVIGWK